MKKSYYFGCLLGGAVGDALGYPVEFQSENFIFEKYGKEGIQTLEQAGNPAKISDDTQMTLFAVNGILQNRSVDDYGTHSSWHAYREWLGTQGNTCCMEKDTKPKMWIYEDERLHVCRAPGSTCLSAIRWTEGRTEVMYANNNNKGCGTVMRAAPFGLTVHHDPDQLSYGDESNSVLLAAKYDAMLTHGHVLAYASSMALADIIYQVVQKHPQRDCTLQQLLPKWFAAPELKELMDKAVKLALDETISDLDGIHALGEGWVAEEALAIAVFCAVRYQDDFAQAIRAAVNHKGDSDSTGAICGNILGAWLGKEAVENAFDLSKLELVDLIETMAEDLYRAIEVGIPKEGTDLEWDEKYRRR